MQAVSEVLDAVSSSPDFRGRDANNAVTPVWSTGSSGGDVSVPCMHPSCGAGNKPGLRFQGLQDKRKIVPRDYKARN